MTGNAIREALEPFAKALEEASIGTPDTVSLWFHPSAMGLTVGDLRRARTASDAIGSGVKALEWSNGFASTSFGSYDVCEEDDGWHFAVTDYPHRVMDDRSFSYEHEAKAAAQADFERRVLSCLSTNTAAGAGPVGEAVAWQWRSKLGPDGWSNASIAISDPGDLNEQFEKRPLYARPVEEPGEAVAWREFVLSRIKALGEGDQYGLKSFAIAELQSILDHVARPVKEPGEVERLTRERDVARECHSYALKLAKTAEAALAETRERLGKREDALREIASLEEYDVWTANGHAKCNSIARAALKGDA